MRAVYYCRVSTEQEIQLEALEDQIKEAEDCIKANGWELIDKYIDEGKSGTTTKRRDEYNRLFEELSIDKFDLIVIKSQDRLMRSAKDWYIFIDALVTNGKKLYFYLDRAFYEPDNSLITGIKAIMAEEYSRDLSKKINNAHRNRQANGGKPVITSSTWGYDKIDKQVVINEKEAEIVRLIFDLSIQGYGSRLISKTLSNMGIKSRTGKEFAEVTVRRIVQNELFKGTVVMNKRHKDFNTKKEIKNPPEEWIYHENAVPAIVTPEIWEKANAELDKRRTVDRCKDRGDLIRGYNKGKFNFSSKIICGECGSIYWRRKFKVKSGHIARWMCSEYITRGRKENKDPDRRQEEISVKGAGCDNVHVSEEDILNLLALISKDLNGGKRKEILDKSVSILREVFTDGDTDKDKAKLEADKNKIISQKNILMDKLLDGIITDADYKRKDVDLEERLKKLKEKEILLNEREKAKEDVETRIAKIKEMLEDSGADTGVFRLVDHLIKIVVFRDHLDFYFDFLDPLEPIKVKNNKKNISM